MRSRFLTVSLATYLALTLFACSKPADQTADTSTATPDNAAAPEKSGSGGGARKSRPAGEKTKEAAAAEQPKPEPVVVPAGTALTVRLGQSVGSKISQPGGSFTATLSAPVAVNGQTVIPSGATANGTVVDAKPLGRFKGGAVLSLKLTSINLNGTDQPVQTSAVTQSEKGKGKRTAVLAGGGAGLGALIGGLAGGGKGALIGGAAGAGAGTAGAAFTGNKDIVLPAESALSFTLAEPLTVKP